MHVIPVIWAFIKDIFRAPVENEDERYLSQAVDHVDLERRQKEIEMRRMRQAVSFP
jgi:hypothetical protein